MIPDTFISVTSLLELINSALRMQHSSQMDEAYKAKNRAEREKAFEEASKTREQLGWASFAKAAERCARTR